VRILAIVKGGKGEMREKWVKRIEKLEKDVWTLQWKLTKEICIICKKEDFISNFETECGYGYHIWFHSKCRKGTEYERRKEK